MYAFQFPSNGKVDPNKSYGMDPVDVMSLGFNSLQTGKWILTTNICSESNKLKRSFNSLQTGKWILTESRSNTPDTPVSFNSLQTGKWILTQTR